MNNQSSIARKRWHILGKTLKTGKIQLPSADSVRSFQSFGLFAYKKCLKSEDNLEDSEEWFAYSNSLFPAFSLHIRHCSNIYSLEDLTGFNNTGNVGIWPSEEVLAHYCLVHQDMFNGKTTCEIGGGMTSLAGMVVGYSNPENKVTISDGNDKSVENLQKILERNKTLFPRNQIIAKKICWGPDCVKTVEESMEKFDYILCADCLFFKETIESLMELIHMFLKQDGIAIIVAPGRSGTFKDFCNIAKFKFVVNTIEIYDEFITKLHKENLLNNPLYCEDLHYPLMTHLKKK